MIKKTKQTIQWSHSKIHIKIKITFQKRIIFQFLLFNGISTLMGYPMPKPSLQKNSTI